MVNVKASRISLECRHEIWLKPPLPRKGDLVYCVKCAASRHVGVGITRSAVEYYPDYDWKSIPRQPSGYRGECLVIDCEYSLEERWDWFRLRKKMERHHLYMHSDTPLLTFGEKVPIPGSNALDEPPF